MVRSAWWAECVPGLAGWRWIGRSLAGGHVVLALAIVAGGAARAGELSLATGVEYTSGKYGDTAASTSWYLPLVARYEQGPLIFRATLPYLRNTGAVSRTPDGVAIPGTGGTQEGFGDIVLAAGATLWSTRDLSIDGVAKLKLPTADPGKELGTGKTDWSMQVDGVQRVGPVSVLATVGWKKYGDPDGVDFRNPLFASLGFSWRLSAVTSVGLYHDWRERLRPRGSEVSEATAYVTVRLDPAWKLQLYGVKGFSDASPDFGAGLMVSRTY